jgi:B12 binding domain/Radical SAM superfamily/Protein of unknown function (DUF4080)
MALVVARQGAPCRWRDSGSARRRGWRAGRAITGGVEIVLATLNAKYIHASFGLRCLRANLGRWRERSTLCELTIQERPVDVVERLLAEAPSIIGLGVYVWNAAASLAVVRMLKQVAPQVRIVLGGPEVSHELDRQPIVALADHVITGEGEVAFAALVDRLMSGRPHLTKVIAGGLPDLAALASPYDEYTDHDLAHRVVYVEASRGCPFSCEFCLSSLDTKVRGFPLDRLLAELDRLVSRGLRQLKFVDRTFNLSPKTSHALLDFLLERQALGVFGHFEMVPDRFPEGLRQRIASFPKGAIQLEVGIQTFDPATGERISRRQDVAALENNLRFLAEHTGAHVHADLIIGLPGEDLASFAAGLDRLVALGPEEIQVGVLKRLRGTPIDRHDQEYQVVWSEDPPYEILANRLIGFAEMQRMKRFARVWDLVINRGNFLHAVPLLWRGRSPFESVLALTDFLAARVSLGGVALPRLTELIMQFLVEVQGEPSDEVGRAMAEDFMAPGRRAPACIQPYVTAAQRARAALAAPVLGPGDARPSRQQRHHGGS